MAHWKFLRWTMRTHLSALPVQDVVRELVIAHAKQGLHKVYDLHAYRDEKLECLTLWEARPRGIVAPKLPGDVADITAERAARKVLRKVAGPKSPEDDSLARARDAFTIHAANLPRRPSDRELYYVAYAVDLASNAPPREVTHGRNRLKRMARWSTHILLHASGAEPEHYQAVIAAAEGGARVLVIETNPASAPSWLRVLTAIPPRKTLVIWPRDGIRPIPEDRSSAN